MHKWRRATYYWYWLPAQSPTRADKTQHAFPFFGRGRKRRVQFVASMRSGAVATVAWEQFVWFETRSIAIKLGATPASNSLQSNFRTGSGRYSNTVTKLQYKETEIILLGSRLVSLLLLINCEDKVITISHCHWYQYVGNTRCGWKQRLSVADLLKFCT